jgi:UDP-N-acetylmuramoylalanine--D-glutamate ligase
LKALVLSPGVPLTHPAPHDVVVRARAAGVEIIGDIELFAREIRPDRTKPGRAPIIAVTGTNGKSTTTALIGHILTSAGFAAEIGGNIGKPVLDLATPNGRTIYVLEVSSYQIDLARGLVPDIAVLTNITPDHIERHGSLENYAAVKARLLEQTDAEGQVVIGVDDPHASSIRTRLAARGRCETVPVSVGKVLGRGIFAVDTALYDAWGSRAARVMDLSTATHLPGAHNWQNAALAFAATKPFVKDTRSIVSAIASFPGLAHRIEDVGRVGKVRFVNDSKATNADAAERALVCFNDIFWIAGGRPKAGGIESLVPHFPRIRKAYLIGEAANEFARTLDGRVTYEIVQTLDQAVVRAAADARLAQFSAPVVLLSPACASFDQFRDFEERGEAFRAGVNALAEHGVREAS